jgi:hypothetical protein
VKHPDEVLVQRRDRLGTLAGMGIAAPLGKLELAEPASRGESSER